MTLPVFAHLRAEPVVVRERAGGGAWWALLLIGTLVPAVSFIALPLSGKGFIPLSGVFPQGITNQLVAWALANAVVAVVVGLALRTRPSTSRIGPMPAVMIALATMAVGYLVVWLAGRLLLVDFRFWVVALKPLSVRQALAATAYFIPFTVFLVVAFRGLASLMARGQSAAGQYATAIAALALGFAVVVAIAYTTLFATGALPGWAPALNAIVAIQFVPLLAALGAIFAFTWRRTGSYLPGALIASLFVTWYIVAGQATHFVG
jgi:hypothetical protein